MEAGKIKIVRSEHPLHFFSRKEKSKMIAAIRQAESRTSGEIRLHLVKTARKDILIQAREIFEKIGMARTRERNGVLIFIAVSSRQFVILGDKGIDEKVPAGFWDRAVEEMKSCFREDRFGDGIVRAIMAAGEKLKEYFPRQLADINELSDTISYSA